MLWFDQVASDVMPKLLKTGSLLAPGQNELRYHELSCYFG